MTSAAGHLHLAVFDEEDLAVVSTHLQDAHVAIGDIAYLPPLARFALVVSRVDWRGMTQGRQERRRTGFHFDRVARVRRSGFAQDAPTKALHLLAVSFQPTLAPSGEVLLTFAGGNMIKLDVECLEGEMRDLSDCWPVQDCPQHRLDETLTGG